MTKLCVLILNKICDAYEKVNAFVIEPIFSNPASRGNLYLGHCLVVGWVVCNMYDG